MKLMKEFVITNKAMCKLCGDIIESKNRHDYVTCKCGQISVDGGTAYIKRSARNLSNIIELSDTYEKEVEYD